MTFDHSLIHRKPCFPLAWAIVSLAFSFGLAAADLPPATSQSIDFGRDVYPLLKAHCLRCHTGADAESGVRLDALRELLGETNGQPLVVIGQSASSRLIQLVARQDERLVMPPANEGKPLSAGQIGILRAWIDQGLKWDDKLLPPPDPSNDHWAFQPMRSPALPQVTRRDWPRTPADFFIAAAQEQRNMGPSELAAPAIRLRRLSLDLTGLPPTVDALDEFLTAEAEGQLPDAWSRQVDRLLASPAYGERWGRHWLDLARWAESEGYESNHPRPYAWKYRDFVIRSFNRDRPYDEFLRDQIAGDEQPNFSDEQLIATGYLAGARLSSNEEDKLLQRNAVLVDIVNAVGEGVLGLTVACAQCHNHKFDPLTQRDYYRLQAFFVAGQPANLVLHDPAGWRKYEAAKPAEYDPAVSLRKAIEERVREKILTERRQKFSPATQAAIAKSPAERSPAEQELARQADLDLQLLTGQLEKEIPADDRALYEALKKKIAEIEKTLPDKPQTWGYYSPRTASALVDILPMRGFYPLPYDPAALKSAQAFLPVRGDIHRRGPNLDPGVPEFLDFAPEKSSGERTVASRTQLVDWLVSPHHPLTARVWVNRLWQHHFGQGLVRTPGDFGVKGAPPSHPELLDFLAAELISQGWSTKHLHRMLVLSNTYQQASTVPAAQRQLDPTNEWWTRWSPRRLESEAVRDSLLAVSGELDHAAFGPGNSDPATRRRAVYQQQLRDRPPEIQRLFDAPSANECCSKRHVSTVALQPLFLMNHALSVTMAGAMAGRLEAVASSEDQQIDLAFRWVLARPPDAAERGAARDFLRTYDETPAEPSSATAAVRPLSRLAAFCQTLLNLDEFHYLE